MRLKFTLTFATAFLLLARWRPPWPPTTRPAYPSRRPSAPGALDTAETGGHAICVVRLTADHSAKVATIAETPHRLAATGCVGHRRRRLTLTGAGGQALAPFNRWSNSLFVSHRSSGVDVQLMRGPPQG